MRERGTYRRQGFIFANSAGNPLDHTRIAKRWKALLASAGLPELRLYDLRHSHATHMLEEGIHPKVVQERLGHASVTLTLDTYSHVQPAMHEKAADQIGRMFDRVRKAS